MLPQPLEVGDEVEVATIGGKVGTLLEVRGKEGVVAVGAMKLTVPLRTLARTAQQRVKPEIVVPMMGGVPEVHAPSEIDLRGMRIHEVDDYLLQSIDAAVRADLRSVRIIHGKGTGALRQTVREFLQQHPLVEGFEGAKDQHGGEGATLARIRQT